MSTPSTDPAVPPSSPLAPPHFLALHSKILGIIILLVVVLLTASIMVGERSYQSYRKLQIASARALVDEFARTMKDTVQMHEHNAQELATLGTVLLQVQKHRFIHFSEQAILHYFRINQYTIGGGIWYAPNVATPQQERKSFYAYRDISRNQVKLDSYKPGITQDYYQQTWYLDAYAKLSETGPGNNSLKQSPPVFWSSPYVDAMGTKSMMTTVSAGIYANNGRQDLLGLATLDWRIADIDRLLATIRPTAHSTVLLSYDALNTVIAFSGSDHKNIASGSSPQALDWYRQDSPAERYFQQANERYLSFTRHLSNGMRVTVNVPESELFAEVHQNLRLTFIALCLTVLVGAFILWLLLKHFITLPVARLSRAVGEVSAGRLQVDFFLPQRGIGDELSALSQAFSDMTKKLQKHIHELGQTRAQQERIATELKIAHDIQAAMLPHTNPPFAPRPDCNVRALMRPAAEVGGDFYDFFFLDEQHLALVIADVSDKGVPAALFMANTKTLLRHNAIRCQDPGKALAITNEELCKNNAFGMFVTTFIGIIDLQHMVFSYANAGHLPFYWRDDNGTFQAQPLIPALPLAVMENTVFPTQTLALGTQGVLLFYTDGITEACNAAGEFWGDKGLRQSLQQLDGVTPPSDHELAQWLEQIEHKLQQFVGAAAQHDDITLMLASYRAVAQENEGKPTTNKAEIIAEKSAETRAETNAETNPNADGNAA